MEEPVLKNRLIKGMLFLFAGLLLIPVGKILAGPGGPLIRVAFRPPNEQQPFSFRRDAPAGCLYPTQVHTPRSYRSAGCL